MNAKKYGFLQLWVRTQGGQAIKEEPSSNVAAAFFSTQTVAVKLAWWVPRTPHTYFVQKCLVLGTSSAMTELPARFAGFSAGLRNAPDKEVRTVALLSTVSTVRPGPADNYRTYNIRIVEEASGLSVWNIATAQVRRP